MVPHLPPSKTYLRQTQQAIRQAIPPDDHAAFSAACCEHLCRVIGTLTSEKRIIAGYVPIRAELDIFPALAALREQHALCLPVMPREGKILSFRRFTPGDALLAGKYGIGEPATSQPIVTPDIVITPILAFDAEGNRLGYGAGYYDATLKALRAIRPIVAIGVGFSVQQVAALPAEAQDEKLDIIVTEKEIILLSF